METNAAPDRPHHPRPPRPPRVSEELDRLRLHLEDRPVVTLREIIRVLHGRAYLLLLVLLSLPFITPLPLPGLSTPLGVAIALIAFRLTLGQRPWLPRRVQLRPLSPRFLRRVIGLTERVVRLLEKCLRPRLAMLTETTLLRQSHALLMLVAALGLLLPLPIPFSNSFPAWVVLLVAGGLLERDGAAILLAYVVFAAGVLYFLLLGEAAGRIVQIIRDRLF